MEATMLSLIVGASVVLASIQKEFSFVIVYCGAALLYTGLVLNALH